jgi:hypothetical protein
MPRPAPSGAPGCATRRRGHLTTAEGSYAAPGKSYAAGARQPAPADYCGRPVLLLNSDWAVGDDSALQWFLHRRAGEGWHPRRFHVERDALLRSICELCGTADAAVVATIRGWPTLYRPDALAVPTTRPGASDV